MRSFIYNWKQAGTNIYVLKTHTFLHIIHKNRIIYSYTSSMQNNMSVTFHLKFPLSVLLLRHQQILWTLQMFWVNVFYQMSVLHFLFHCLRTVAILYQLKQCDLRFTIYFINTFHDQNFGLQQLKLTWRVCEPCVKRSHLVWSFSCKPHWLINGCCWYISGTVTHDHVGNF